MKSASEMVRDYREKHGLTQTHIAQSLGVRPQRISAYETGLIKIPADDFLKIIVDGFGITPQNFFDEQLSKNEN